MPRTATPKDTSAMTPAQVAEQSYKVASSAFVKFPSMENLNKAVELMREYQRAYASAFVAAPAKKTETAPAPAPQG